MKHNCVKLSLKRLIDILGSALALFCLGPVMIWAAVLVRRKLGNPVLFKQIRPGFNGKSFEMFKFRTMRDAFDANGNQLPDEARLTTFGKFLRSTSIDELPELINVLKGDMSLVGPRPLLMEYLELYNQEQKRRHDVRPGITGWAQINGRNAISWKRKFELDVWYVDNHSIWLDVKILFLTFWKVLRRSDINQEGKATAEKFNGSN